MITDSHCHLNAYCTNLDLDLLIKKIRNDEKLERVHLMSTNLNDLDKVEYLINCDKSEKIIGYFGVHPWYSHLFTDQNIRKNNSIIDKKNHYERVLSPKPLDEYINRFPMPINIDEYVQNIEEKLKKYQKLGYQVQIGEIGVDRVHYTYLNNENDEKYRFNVSFEHQNKIFKKQVELAEKMGVGISVHCVKAFEEIADSLSNLENTKYVVMHSYSGNSEFSVKLQHLLQKKCAVFFSFSEQVNGKKRLLKMIENIPDTSILLESDLMIDSKYLEVEEQEYHGCFKSILEKICQEKKWTNEFGQKQIEQNSSRLNELSQKRY